MGHWGLKTPNISPWTGYGSPKTIKILTGLSNLWYQSTPNINIITLERADHARILDIWRLIGLLFGPFPSTGLSKGYIAATVDHLVG